MRRREVVVDGTRPSYLHAGSGTPVLLLYGTFWSRVWEPILAAVAAPGHEVLALDPGLRPVGRLVRDEAAVPALAACALRLLDALGVAGPLVVVGHDSAERSRSTSPPTPGALASHRRHHKHR